MTDADAFYIHIILTILLAMGVGQLALLANVMLRLGKVSATQDAHHLRLSQIEEELR